MEPVIKYMNLGKLAGLAEASLGGEHIPCDICGCPESSYALHGFDAENAKDICYMIECEIDEIYSKKDGGETYTVIRYGARTIASISGGWKKKFKRLFIGRACACCVVGIDTKRNR